jgi:outer membrane PBP1 activator LpoA protein
LILDRVLSSEEMTRIAQQRAEQLAAELKRQQAAEKAAAERLAKIKADKLARDKARALAAEKRRAQLAALKAKIAATKARGEVLKQKYSWINLMKDFSKPAKAKKLVGTPVK